MNVTYIRNLHYRVIHQEKAKASFRSIFAELRQVKRIKDDKRLISICKECFPPPS